MQMQRAAPVIDTFPGLQRQIKLAREPAQNRFQFKHVVQIQIQKRIGGLHGRIRVFNKQACVCLRLGKPRIQLVATLAERLEKTFRGDYWRNLRQRAPLFLNLSVETPSPHGAEQQNSKNFICL